ncbi:MAG: MltA domain-containing protein [Kofleriaceae bacterium]|nr:MltA domain-containing protein [Kofleriaceae bacterium]
MRPPAPAWILAVAALVGAGCGQRDRAAGPGRGDAGTAAGDDGPADAAAGDARGPADAAVATASPPCPEPPPPPPGPGERLTLHPVDFADLPGWSDDSHAEALPALLASCTLLAELADDAPVGVDGAGGKARAWRALCAAARAAPAGDDAAARALFERHTRAFAAHGPAGADGKFTGYYVQPLRGSRRRHGRYQHPLYGRPDDLVMVDLGQFIPDARGRKIWGQLDRGRGVLGRYPTRAEIRAGGKAPEILWVDDPIDAVFAQIQGSGKVALDDGSEAWIEFAGKNGRAYRGVGGVLKELGELAPGQGTMQGIRAWLAAHPDRFDEIVDRNQSFVFFAVSARPGAIGSQQVVLTPRRSMAVDRAHIAASTPIWVDTRAPTPGRAGTAPWRRLLVAQDTGEGIKGAVRGDIYWGDDADAVDTAGRMGGPGRYWLLLPPGAAPRAP